MVQPTPRPSTWPVRSRPRPPGATPPQLPQPPAAGGAAAAPCAVQVLASRQFQRLDRGFSVDFIPLSRTKQTVIPRSPRNVGRRSVAELVRVPSPAAKLGPVRRVLWRSPLPRERSGRRAGNPKLEEPNTKQIRNSKKKAPNKESTYALLLHCSPAPLVAIPPSQRDRLKLAQASSHFSPVPRHLGGGRMREVHRDRPGWRASYGPADWS